jgi:6-pyruvoyltetrahydropterin/6-carboxytetrahydropterin synthase
VATRGTAMYLSTKTFPPLSCCFRNWRADSHCKFLHGYAIEIKIVFFSDSLDVRNWVVDFGSLKSLKGMFEEQFDHRTIIAEDDPHIGIFRALHGSEIIQLHILPISGSCEKLSEYIAGVTEVWLKDNGYAPRVGVHSVEVKEHGANSAIYIPTDDNFSD